MPLPQEKLYTIDDIYALPEGTRAELIDGQIYYMTRPSTRHQEIVGNIFAMIWQYITGKKGECKPLVSPFAVYLEENNHSYVEPDYPDCVI